MTDIRRTRRTGGFRAGRLAAALTLWVLGTARITHALDVEATLGYNSVYVPGAWTPVTVLVENLPRADKASQKLEPFDGDVIVWSQASSTQRRQIAFTRPLTVPVNDRKRITVFAKYPAYVSGACWVDLVTKSGRRTARVDVFPKYPVSKPDRLFVFIRSADSSFDLARIENMPLPVKGTMDPGEIPDQWYGYDGASMVVIPKMTDKLFSPEAAGALRKWVSQGGNLLLIGGRNGQSYSKSPVDDILPADYLGSEAYEIREEAWESLGDGSVPTTASAVTVNRVKSRPDAETILSAGDVPLLVTRKIGSGTVFFLTTDWTPRLLREIPLDKYFTTYLATRADFSGARSRFANNLLNNSGGVLGLGSAIQLPRQGIILLILVSYLVIVGPLNFFLLARIKRLEWAWLTVPAIVAIFTGGIYFVSASIKGRDTVLRSFHLVTGRAGGDTVRCDTLAMMFVQNEAPYTLKSGRVGVAQCDFANWAGAGSNWQVAASAPSATDVRIIQKPTGEMTMPGKPVPQWATDFTEFNGIATLGGKIEADLEINGTRVTGRVSNMTNQGVRSLHLCVGNRAFALGAPAIVAPGGSLPVSADLYSFPALYRSDQTDPYSAQVFNALAPSLNGIQQGSAASDAPSCFLLFELEKPLFGVEIDAGLTIQSAHTIAALETNLTVARDSLPKLDEGVFTMQMDGMDLGRSGSLAQPSAAYRRYDYGSMTGLSGGTATYTFRQPASGLTAAAITGFFSSRSEGVSGGDDSLRMEAFDFASMDWSPLALAPDNALPRTARPSQGPPPRAMMNPSDQSGLSRFRFSGSSLQSALHPLTGGGVLRLAQQRSPNSPARTVYVSLPEISSLEFAASPRRKP